MTTGMRGEQEKKKEKRKKEHIIRDYCRTCAATCSSCDVTLNVLTYYAPSWTRSVIAIKKCDSYTWRRPRGFRHGMRRRAETVAMAIPTGGKRAVRDTLATWPPTTPAASLGHCRMIASCACRCLCQRCACNSRICLIQKIRIFSFLAVLFTNIILLFEIYSNLQKIIIPAVAVFWIHFLVQIKIS